MVHIDFGKEWPDVQTKLRSKLSKDEYESWFAGLQFVSFSDWIAPVLTVSVAMPFLKHWISNHYLTLLQTTASDVYGPIDKVVIQVRSVGLRSPILPTQPKPAVDTYQKDSRLQPWGAGKLTVTRRYPRPLPATATPSLEPESFTMCDLKEERISDEDASVLELTPEEIDEMAKRKDRGILIEDIQRSVCRHFGIHETDLKSLSLQRLHRQARNVGMYLAYKLTNYPLKTIGKHFGNRDDSTVLHAKRETAQQIKIDDPHKTSVILLTRELMKQN